jgi:hypothetical protein
MSKDMRKSYRRLVPKTVDIKPNKTLVHNLCFAYLIDIVTLIPESDPETAECRGLRNAEPYDHSSSQSTILVIKPREIRWARQVARVGDRRGAYRVWLVDPRKINHLERLRIDRRVILK